MPKLKIKKGDKVVVITGSDKGKTRRGAARAAARRTASSCRASTWRSATRKPRAGEPGGIVEKEAAIHVSNVAHIDPKTSKPTRVGFRILEDGRKVRFARRSGEVIDRVRTTT